jgi:methionyl aminopeptidase
VCRYNGKNGYRGSDVEKKQLERAMGFEDLVKEARWAAESHRVTRQWVKTTLKEGDLMTDICERIENKTRACSGLTPPPSTAA